MGKFVEVHITTRTRKLDHREGKSPGGLHKMSPIYYIDKYGGTFGLLCMLSPLLTPTIYFHVCYAPSPTLYNIPPFHFLYLFPTSFYSFTPALAYSMWLRSMAGATRSHQRPLEPCTTMLMAELVAQIREASRQAWRRSRVLCLQAPPGCADYTWLISLPQAPPSFDISSGVCLELEDLCGQLRPRDCGPAILRFRQLIESHEPEPSEVPMLFRSTLREFAECPPRTTRARDGGSGAAPRRTHSLLWNLVPGGRSIGWFSTARIRPTPAVSTISADVEWSLPSPAVRTESEPNVQFMHEDDVHHSDG
uniref:Uncharacterized protein n=2 Tax=Eptatretus burgeri TaxID=7764 RepID=A0A8C4R3G6_EPTBU